MDALHTLNNKLSIIREMQTQTKDTEQDLELFDFILRSYACYENKEITWQQMRDCVRDAYYQKHTGKKYLVWIDSKS